MACSRCSEDFCFVLKNLWLLVVGWTEGLPGPSGRLIFLIPTSHSDHGGQKLVFLVLMSIWVDGELK
jgi:hypothetical protein